jgi:hypothetical protein
MSEPEVAFPTGAQAVLARARSFALPLAATAWYASPWATATRRDLHEGAGIPSPGRRLAVLAGVATDELCRAFFTLVRRLPTPEELARIESETADAIARYEREGWLRDPASYHRAPPAPVAMVEPTRVDIARFECVRFPSAYTPHPGEPGAERWASYSPNENARAYVLRHRDGPRPWLVCIHATEMGRPEIDRRLFRVRYVHEELGCNVALPVLPLHGSRRPPRGTGAFFPAIDVLDNVHGLAQAASDVRSVLAWIREQDAPGIGLVGVSLGGYVTALVAGLEGALDCVIAGLPVVDFPDLFLHNAPPEVRSTPRYQALGELAGQAHEVVAPLRLEPATPVDRRFVFAGLADRLADPVHHAGALWAHWGRPSIHWFEGGHVGHLVDRSIARYIDDALSSCLVTRRRESDAD